MTAVKQRKMRLLHALLRSQPSKCKTKTGKK
jgi:hypothetical protein